ncbi:MAG: hypothetical protein PHW03_09420 [Eubacteriales bacterium]|nr:hypothetical protein [Eubacteriales bacterium]
MPFSTGAPRPRTSQLIVDSDITMTPGNKIVTGVIECDMYKGITKAVFKGSIQQIWHLTPRMPYVYHVVYAGSSFVANTNWSEGASALYRIAPPNTTLSGNMAFVYTSSYAGCSAYFTDEAGTNLGACVAGLNIIPNNTVGIAISYAKGDGNAAGSASISIAEYDITGVY